MPDNYTLRNLAMFLYPIYGYFFYKNYKWPKWIIAYPLCAFILWTMPWPNYYNKFFLTDKIVQNYTQRKSYKFIGNYTEYINNLKIGPIPTHCDNDCKASDIVFRFLIWQDMISEIISHKAIFGMGLSHPLRSPQLEKLHWAEQEWGRDGWISAHNSYLYIVYRIGILGLGAILGLFYALWNRFWALKRAKDTSGLVLMGCLGYWLLLACWSEQFQVPYHAIPTWAVLGIIFVDK